MPKKQKATKAKTPPSQVSEIAASSKTTTSLSDRISAVAVVLAKLLVIFIGGQIVGSFIISIIGVGFGASNDSILTAIESNDVVRFLLILCIEVVTVWFVHLFLKREKQSFKAIGLQKKLTFTHVKTAIAGYIIYFASYVAIVGIVSALQLINTDQKQQIGFENAAGVGLVWVFMSLVLLPPIAEEIVFRGFLLHKLKSKASTFVATVITSVLFAVAHLEFGSGNSLNWAAALDTFVLSLILCHVTLRTKSLWPAILIHMLKNGMAFVALFVLA